MNAYLIFILALLVFNWLLNLIVETLNVRNVSTEIPEEFQGVYDAEKYAKSQRYLRDNTRFGQIQAAIMLPLTIAFILLGGFRWINGIALAASPHMIVQGLVFGGILILLGQLVGIPFSIYDTFVLEEKYGFNKTTPKTFVLDILKGLLLTVLLGAPVFALILWIFDAVSFAWLWAWGALAVIGLFIQFIAPVVILPLFNKFTPLEESELRAKIEDYAAAQKYKLSGIFKIDGSKRSTKSNAYFTGFGKTKRIALFDTLIEKHTVPELVGVLAHEIGHCKRGHIKKGIVISLASSLLMFFILSLFITKQGLYAAFGIEGTPLYAGFIFFGFLYAPISMILGIAGSILSRKHEFEADAFAAETTKEPGEMISALKKLSVDNLSNLTPHPLKVFLQYSHPPVLARIKALRGFMYSHAESNDSQKKYGGIGRGIYFFGLLITYVIVHTTTASLTTFRLASVLALLSTFLLTVFRLKNLGMSLWRTLLIFIPIANLLVVIPCFLAQEGYEKTKRLDLTGKLISGSILILIALVIILALAGF